MVQCATSRMDRPRNLIKKPTKKPKRASSVLFLQTDRVCFDERSRPPGGRPDARANSGGNHGPSIARIDAAPDRSAGGGLSAAGPHGHSGTAASLSLRCAAALWRNAKSG